MTALTGAGNTGMVKAAVRIQFQKSCGVMTVITFGTGFNMELRFPDSHLAVMALATGTEDFLVVHIRDLIKTQW